MARAPSKMLEEIHRSRPDLFKSIFDTVVERDDRLRGISSNWFEDYRRKPINRPEPIVDEVKEIILSKDEERSLYEAVNFLNVEGNIISMEMRKKLAVEWEKPDGVLRVHLLGYEISFKRFKIPS